jgi:hypothetical protein
VTTGHTSPQIKPEIGDGSTRSAQPADFPADANRRAAPGLTRRGLLRRGGLEAGTALVVSAGGLGYRAYDEGVFQTGEGGAYDAWRDWNKPRGPMAVVAAAILAANAHNTQAWVFHVSSQQIDVFADSSRNIGAVDPSRREMYVSLGAAVENLLQAARRTGTPRSCGGCPRLANLFTWPRSRSRRGRRAARSSTSRYPTGIPTALRIGAGCARRCARADVGAGGGSAGIARVLVHQRIGPWSDRRFDDRGGSGADRRSPDTFWVKHTRDPQTKTAAAYGIIAVPDPHSDAQRLSGGRLLQRVHLWTAAHGLSPGHMNQITERVDRERQLGLASRFGDASCGLIPNAGFQQLVAFRIGYPSGTDGRRPSPRRPAAAVIR